MRIAIQRANERDPERFRVVHYSVQRDHLHLMVEATDARVLSAGMRGLVIRIARYVNELLLRRGPLWADRWHGRALSSPRSVRAALLYVLANFRKHARAPLPPGLDPFSSAAFCDGWKWPSTVKGRGPPRVARGAPSETGTPAGAPVVSEPRSWLASVGWKRAGLLGVDEVPPGALRASGRGGTSAPTGRLRTEIGV